LWYFCLLHGSTYVELNKICFIIFRFFYELLRIYQFLADLKNKRKVNWRFYIGNPRKIFIFFLSSILPIVDVLSRPIREPLIWDFALGTLESFLFSFCSCVKESRTEEATDSAERRFRKPNGDRSRRKKKGRLKFCLFISRYRFNVPCMCPKIRWDGWKIFGWETKQGLNNNV
jgi:hypothetical protein